MRDVLIGDTLLIHYMIISWNMPTSKKRINISLPADIERVLAELAERDDLPQATKAVQLLRLAIETDEDEVLDKIAAKRDSKKSRFVNHEKAWK